MNGPIESRIFQHRQMDQRDSINDDPFAELVACSSNAPPRPLLQRSQTDAMMRGRSHNAYSVNNSLDAMAPIDNSASTRLRCNSIDCKSVDPTCIPATYENTLAVNECRRQTSSSSNEYRASAATSVGSGFISASSTVMSPVNSPCNLKVANNILLPESSHDLLIFEERERASTLESVMAVKSISSIKSSREAKSVYSQKSATLSESLHKSNPSYARAAATYECEINDDKSDVSSLSDYDRTKQPPSARMGNTLSSLLKRPLKPLRPLVPARLRSEATSTETATTAAMHTLETIDNFDVASPFSPLGALSGKEELTFFKSASNVSSMGSGYDEYGSLHGYHRRGARHVRTESSSDLNRSFNNSDLVRNKGGGHTRTRSHGHSRTESGGHKRTESDLILHNIQNSWLVPSPSKGQWKDDDMIDMEHEIIDMSMFPSHDDAIVPSFGASASVTSTSGSLGGGTSPMKSVDNITAMSTAESEHEHEHSLPKPQLKRPPMVSRAKTSPALFHDRRTLSAYNKKPSQSGINTPCMFGSIALAEAISPKAISFPRRPSSSNNLDNVSVAYSQNSPSLPSLDEEASCGSFKEEMKRKDKGKMLRREMKQMSENVVKKGKKILGLNVKGNELKRSDGCLT